MINEYYYELGHAKLITWILGPFLFKIDEGLYRAIMSHKLPH